MLQVPKHPMSQLMRDGKTLPHSCFSCIYRDARSIIEKFDTSGLFNLFADHFDAHAQSDGLHANRQLTVQMGRQNVSSCAFDHCRACLR